MDLSFIVIIAIWFKFLTDIKDFQVEIIGKNKMIRNNFFIC